MVRRHHGGEVPSKKKSVPQPDHHADGLVSDSQSSSQHERRANSNSKLNALARQPAGNGGFTEDCIGSLRDRFADSRRDPRRNGGQTEVPLIADGRRKRGAVAHSYRR